MPIIQRALKNWKKKKKRPREKKLAKVVSKQFSRKNENRPSTQKEKYIFEQH